MRNKKRNLYGLNPAAPGWITVRNTVGEALVGMQANKAGLVKALDGKWKLTVWQKQETATRGWMNDIYIEIHSFPSIKKCV